MFYYRDVITIAKLKIWTPCDGHGMDGELRIMVLACQVDPFHLKLTQINGSERNCIAKHKSPDSQKVDTRDAEVRTSKRVTSNDMYT